MLSNCKYLSCSVIIFTVVIRILLLFRGFMSLYILYNDRGSTVVKVLCYKSEGRWFDPSWCHWNFSLT